MIHFSFYNSCESAQSIFQHEVLEKDQIFIPFTWDSIAKIKLMNSNNSEDINQLIESFLSDDMQQFTNIFSLIIPNAEVKVI